MALANLSLDHQHNSFRWNHGQTNVTLSCIPFSLEQHPGQTFWSYTVFIDPQGDIELVRVVSEVVAAAQYISDQRLLPSSWIFNVGNIIVRHPRPNQRSLSNVTGPIQSPSLMNEVARRGTRGPIQPQKHVDLVPKLVSLVVNGGTSFLADEEAQLSWESDVEQLRPTKSSPSHQDLINAFGRYSRATGRRSWQAKLLIGFSLLDLSYVRNRKRIENERALKRFASWICHLLNHLFEGVDGLQGVDEIAFKVIPAMSAGDTGNSSILSMIGQLSKVDCRFLGEAVAVGLLRDANKSWTEIDIKFALDPAELVQLDDRTIDQIRTTIGLRASLDRSSASSHKGPVNTESEAISPTKELPLPSILPYDSPIFVCVQEGNLEETRRLFCSASAHINTLDPFGLSLLYYASYYCFRARGVKASLMMYTELVKIGVSSDWMDEIGNTAKHTMYDSALMHFAMERLDRPELSNVIKSIARLDGEIEEASDSELLRRYFKTRHFSPIHRAVIGLDGVDDPLLTRLGTALMSQYDVDQVDSHGRSPLTWAVEYRHVNAVKALLSIGASATFVRRSCLNFDMPLLHLLLAGPTDDDDALVSIVEALIHAGADVMATDSDGWTSLHIAASWNMYNVSQRMLELGDRDELLVAKTFKRETAYDLACESGCDEALRSLLGRGNALLICK